MKTKCTSQNNAIEIIKPVECSTVVTTPTTCIDPLTYLWNMASKSSLNTGAAFNTT